MYMHRRLLAEMKWSFIVPMKDRKIEVSIRLRMQKKPVSMISQLQKRHRRALESHFDRIMCKLEGGGEEMLGAAVARARGREGRARCGETAAESPARRGETL
jgi:hypothetical protein